MGQTAINRKKMKIYPVIHLLDSKTAYEQTAIAQKCEVDGIFFISHCGEDETVIQTAKNIKIEYSTLDVGFNLLSYAPDYATNQAIKNELDMVWADAMGVSSKGLSSMGDRLSAMANIFRGMDMFASVAFKYRSHEPNPAQAALNALEAGFIPTTSGVATGNAPDIKKIQSMSKATGGCLAIASGMRPDNVEFYAPYLSHILVATGVSIDDFRIDETKLLELIAVAKETEKHTW